MVVDEEDDIYAANEARRLLASCEDAETFMRCRQDTLGFYPRREDGAKHVVKLVAEALSENKALNLIRVGDGEGNLIGMKWLGEKSPTDFKFFAQKFYSQDGTTIDPVESEGFCTLVYDAIVNANIIGFRSFDQTRRSPDGTEVLISELDLMESVLDLRLPGLLGIVRARQFLEDLLREQALRGKVVMSAWVHLALIEHLDEILAAAKSVIVITGCEVLREKFEHRLGNRLRDFIAIPVQGSRPSEPNLSHYRAHFPTILESLKKDLRGVLVLVGAGFFGKVYCHEARKHGAVALDLGSAFDILANVASRPAHRYLDVEKLRW